MAVKSGSPNPWEKQFGREAKGWCVYLEKYSSYTAAHANQQEAELGGSCNKTRGIHNTAPW